MSYTEDEGSGRPKLSLQPRGSGADQTPLTPSKTSKPNPFGAARPREQVIAEREGKMETEVLREQIQKEWKPSIVLTESQREEKKAAEVELAYAKSELKKEVDPLKSKALKEEVSNMEKKLEDLLASFERMAVQTAQTGGSRRPYEKRREEERGPAAASPVGVGYGGDSHDGYNNFSRGRDRDADRVGSYGDTWGAKGVGAAGGGRGGSSQCFSCGEMGHFSRECPNGGGVGSGKGSYGGNFGGGGGGGRSGGRSCYTCGQEGHISRECPQGGGGGGGGGGYGSRGGYGSGGGNYGGSSYGGYVSSNPEYDSGAYGSGNQGGGTYSSGGNYDDRMAYGNATGRGGVGGYTSRWEG